MDWEKTKFSLLSARPEVDSGSRYRLQLGRLGDHRFCRGDRERYSANAVERACGLICVALADRDSQKGRKLLAEMKEQDAF